MSDMNLTATVVVLLMVVVVVLTVGPAVRMWRRYRGARVVTCPETGRPAAVSVDAGHAAISIAADGSPDLRLAACSRWPERYPCGQECLSQIQDSADGCSVRGLVRQWYAGKHCVYCNKPIADPSFVDRHPALRGPDGITVEWVTVQPQDLPQLFLTHQPVCWDCHVAEQFRRTHPELVIDRQQPPDGPDGVRSTHA